MAHAAAAGNHNAGQSRESRMEAVSNATIAVPLQGDHAHIVVEPSCGTSAKSRNAFSCAPRYRAGCFPRRKIQDELREGGGWRQKVMPRVSKLSAHATFLT